MRRIRPRRLDLATPGLRVIAPVVRGSMAVIGAILAMTVVPKSFTILLANSKSLSFNTLIFGSAQERLD
jgi:hypothetical protein